ncbi:MAG: hypothetical protein IIX36_00640 [Clostridia bacterium]|nr:hypothetical protein [Clostridia bacterium]
MKKILIPVLAVIAVLLIISTVLAQTNKNNGTGTYHTHENGETHYDNQTEPTYHVHDDGVTHWDEH